MAKTKKSKTKASQSGLRNPKPLTTDTELNGKPKGSRNQLCSEYLDTMHALFREGGEKALRKVMEENPAQFMRAIGDLVPKEFGVADDAATNSFAKVWEYIGKMGREADALARASEGNEE
jgi:hypothetical protein